MNAAELNLDDISSLLEGELESNTARISVNEVKEANKATVVQLDQSLDAQIAELTELKRKASPDYQKAGNITISEKSRLATDRAELMFQQDDRHVPSYSRMVEYLMMVGEELIYLSRKNPELKALVDNMGIKMGIPLKNKK